MELIATVELPSYAICPIVNGDFSGLEDNKEDIENIEEFIKEYAGCTFDVTDERTEFCTRPAFGLPTDTVLVRIYKF